MGFKWEDIKKKRIGENSVYARFAPDSQTTIRFVTELVEYEKDWGNGPQQRYCAWALAMDEGGIPKVFEFPVSVVNRIASMVDEHGVDPWKREAYALRVIRKGSSKENTRYDVIEGKKLVPLPVEYTPEKVASMTLDLKKMKGVAVEDQKNEDLKNDSRPDSNGDKLEF